MKSELSPTYQKLFDEIKQTDEHGNAFWSARDLQVRLGYATWENFESAMARAITTFKAAPGDFNTKVLFRKVTKQHLKKNQYKEYVADVNDYHLTRGACYVIAEGADGSKSEVAAAKIYFAVQTYRQEVNDQRALDWKAVAGRNKLTAAENVMNKVLAAHEVSPKQTAAIRSNGDSMFFGGNKTSDMKKKLGVPEKRPLADFLALVLVSAKSTASSLTALNTETKDLRGFHPINGEHVKNNKEMRELLGKSGVVPETLPAATDIQEVYVRLGLSKGPRKPIADGQQSLL